MKLSKLQKKTQINLTLDEKVFLIMLGIMMFLSFGIAGNIELDKPIPTYSIILYTISVIYCLSRIIVFDLFNE